MSYKRPGVYINETLTPLATAAEDGAASTAVFVGVNSAGGPTVPTRVTSWSQFTQIYGGFGAGNELLPFAVYSYFNNGGAACLVVRATNGDAVAASATLVDGDDNDVLKVSAVSPGVWGNDITVDVSASLVPGHFDLTVRRGTAIERFAEVTLDPASPRNAVSLLNSPYSGSAIVKATYVGPTVYDDSVAPADVTGADLAAGSDGTGTADLVAATKRLETVSGVFDVNLPGVNTSAVINPLVTWAKEQGNVFLVVDGAAGVAADTAANNAASQIDLVSGGSALTRDSVLAVYGPWLTADDPTVSGGARNLPPGGFVLGQYARTDTVRGVQKAAAGIDASLRGVLGPKYVYSQVDLDSLNVAGINAIRVVPGAGTCLFGARTLSVGMPDRYLNIRRSLISIKYNLINLTRFAVFEENDDALRAQIRDIVSQYLRTQWSAGVLAGNTEAAAFSVKCDEENNPPATVAQGFVNVSVGVAPQTPAEFIIFNIGQTISGSTVDES